MPPQEILQQSVNAISLGAVYSLFALGYALVFSVLGVLNLAHGAVFMWGSYVGLLVTRPAFFFEMLARLIKLFGVNNPTLTADLLQQAQNLAAIQNPFWIALPAAMIGGGLMGILLDYLAFRPLRRRNAPRISQLISSIGASTLLISIAQLTFTTEPQAFPLGTLSGVSLQGLPFRVTLVEVLILVTALLLVAILQGIVQRTGLGRAMRAVAFNQRTASLLGINVSRIFINTFFIAGALAGVAGVLFGMNYINSVTPFMGERVALKGLTVVVLGGMGNIMGAVLGGFVVAALETFSVVLGGSDYRDAIVFALLFVILIVRPQGLIGQKEQARA